MATISHYQQFSLKIKNTFLRKHTQKNFMLCNGFHSKVSGKNKTKTHLLEGMHPSTPLYNNSNHIKEAQMCFQGSDTPTARCQVRYGAICWLHLHHDPKYLPSYWMHPSAGPTSFHSLKVLWYLMLTHRLVPMPIYWLVSAKNLSADAGWPWDYNAVEKCGWMKCIQFCNL